jgi:HAD superfamily hydrolase (TIGR01509 family)
MVKAVIFDMDGVMIDSEPLWEKTERIMLRRKGIEYNPTYRDKIVGLNQNDSGKLLRETFNLPETVEEIIAGRIEILLGLYERELELVPGLLPLLKELGASDLLLALASSSPIEAINFVLDTFSLGKFFTVVVSGDAIPLGKPHPDIYLYTADNLGIEPSECVVIEDSINGVKSAKRAGMICLAVPDKRLSLKEFQIADLIVDSLNEVSLEVIKNLS